MAYLAESPLEKERREEQEKSQGGSAGPQLSGPSGLINGGAGQPSAQNAQQGQGPSKSGAFTNLNAYLDANKPQADQLAQNVAGNVAKQAQSAQSQIQNTQQQFTQQADQGSVKRDTNLVNEAVKDATSFVNDKNKVNQFSQMRTAEYKGPHSLSDTKNYGDAYNATKNAQQAVENTKSEAGRFALLQNQNKRSDYNRGMQRLDQHLLQNAQSARDEFADVQKRYGGLSSYLDQANKQSQDYAKAKQTETQAARQDVQQALGGYDDPTTPQNEAAGAMGNFQTEQNKKVQDYILSQQELMNRINANLRGGKESFKQDQNTNLDKDILDMYGLKSGERLYNVDLKNFGPQFNADAVNVQNVSDQDAYAKSAALAQLAGIENTFLADPSLAGSAQGVGVDKDRLRGTLDNARKQYDELNTQLPGLQAAMLNLYRNSGYQFDPVHGRDANADDIRNAVAGIRNTTNREWLRDAEAGSGGWHGDVFRQLRDWSNAFDTLTPNRLVNPTSKQIKAKG